MSESRRRLSIQAAWWRALGKVGRWIHNLPVPRPALPQFTRRFTHGYGVVDLHFYVRDDYDNRMKGERFPVIVNFHGGGFTLGTATDDSRWASMILQEVRAVFVSVEYRLAPEHPFPAAVQDGLEALLYLAKNKERFGIDATQLILSGFSAGGNMTFSIPLKLQAYLQSLSTANTDLIAPSFTLNNIPRIVGIISFYPILDYTISRDEKRAASLRPAKCLPKVFTNLFDAAYLSNEEDRLSPFVSPSLASNEMLAEALPDSIALYLCEWDMLLLEGKEFADRLRHLEKRVDCTIITEEKHAFDKMPALALNPKINLYYGEACTNINRMLATDPRDTDLFRLRKKPNISSYG